MNIALQLDVPQSLTDVAVARIREAIIDGTLGLGQPIPEATLAASFGISKTPVREALVRLQNAGLVTVQPRRGTFVFTLEENELSEICECRTVLELAALRGSYERNRSGLVAALNGITGQMATAWATNDAPGYRRLDTAYHQALFDHCGNRYLNESYNLIAGKLAALRTRLSSSPDHMRKSYDEHVQMRDLLAAGELERVARILDGHIGRRQGSYWITDQVLPRV